ncbi:hypothetical protein KNV66_gp03 [Bacillus phage DLc1]|uniref:Uncharacterized protein n=1 Tax=Bacillus phage DLc1 TaxID=2777318 RepID=A0A7M1RTC7_9CAUD|nr:hypothetical protein KNV66_gp03 [Bacillus phage DLc1]QOR56300.1 hypothetical protein [Bacillus phage DLc1]
MFKASVKLKSGIKTHIIFYSKQEMIEFELQGHAIIRSIKVD